MIKSAEALRYLLDSLVLGDLRTLVRGIDLYYASDDHTDSDGRPIGGGNFLLVGGCCSAIEYFGYIVNDGSTEEARALAFIRKFLVPINQRYSEIDLLLWQCFRHGIIHRSWPKRIDIDGEDGSIATGAGAEKDDAHLSPAPDRPYDTLVINGRQLLADLSSTLDGPFGQWIETNCNEDVFKRANPESLRIGRNAVLRAQAQTVREWNRASRNEPA
jgi:hypothetical protein